MPEMPTWFYLLPKDTQGTDIKWRLPTEHWTSSHGRQYYNTNNNAFVTIFAHIHNTTTSTNSYYGGKLQQNTGIHQFKWQALCQHMVGITSPCTYAHWTIQCGIVNVLVHHSCVIPPRPALFGEARLNPHESPRSNPWIRIRASTNQQSTYAWNLKAIRRHTF